MRFADAVDPDGPSNLTLALQPALNTSLPEQGVQVSFAGELHAARWVRKVDSASLSAFTSDGQPSSSGRLPPSPQNVENDVALVIANALVRQAIPNRCHGVVLHGTGAGHIPSSYFDDIDALWKSGVPVVLSPRAKDGTRRSTSTSASFGRPISRPRRLRLPSWRR
jgi:L-asparaginase